MTFVAAYLLPSTQRDAEQSRPTSP